MLKGLLDLFFSSWQERGLRFLCMSRVTNSKYETVLVDGPIVAAGGLGKALYAAGSFRTTCRYQIWDRGFSHDLPRSKSGKTKIRVLHPPAAHLFIESRGFLLFVGGRGAPHPRRSSLGGLSKVGLREVQRNRNSGLLMVCDVCVCACV